MGCSKPEADGPAAWKEPPNPLTEVATAGEEERIAYFNSAVFLGRN